MEKIVLIGGGGHSKVIIDIIESTDAYEIIGITDKSELCKSVLDIPIIGSDDILLGIHGSGVRYAFICVAGIEHMNLRMELYHKVKTIGFKFPNLIHKSAIISPHAQIGEGTCAMPGVVINPNVKIGNNCVINTGSIVEHDCVIGDNVQISPRATLAGNVQVKDSSFIGIGSNIIQGVTIGENVIIGAGSVVLHDVLDNSVIAGVPAKTIKVRENKNEFKG